MPTHGSSYFLASLSPESRRRITALLEEVDLPVNTPLYQAQEVPAHLYLITSGFASQVVSLPGGLSAEVGVIGREGLVGHHALLGPGLSPNRCYMQSDGAGYRVSLGQFQEVFLQTEDVRNRVLAFTQVHAEIGAYISACNKLHDTEPRLARWLLMVQDRLETDFLPLTQEFLALMLGTRRMTVVLAAGALQRDGLIEYKRGKVRVLDRKALEAAACECYAPIHAAYNRLCVPS